MIHSTDTKLLFLGDWYLTDLVDARTVISHFPFIFNLEAPISKHGKPAPRKINLRMEVDYILACFGRPPFAVCLANNHIMDYGVTAFEDTLSLLLERNIPFFGAGRIEDNCNNPAVIRVGDQRVGFMGYVCPSTHPLYANHTQPGVCPIDLDHIRDDMQKAQAMGATRIVISLHWGAQEVFLPKPQDVYIAHTLIDCGADVIVGHHAHVPQLVGNYRNRPVAYGLGNFAMSDLCVPAYADDNGNFTCVFKQQQKVWNKISLGLLWDVNDKTWEIKESEYDGRMVKRRAPSRFYHRNVDENSKYYPLLFEIHLRKRRLMRMAGNFFNAPKLPRPRQFTSIVRALIRPSRS